MGQTQSKEGTDNSSAQDKEDINVLKRLADDGGPTSVSKFIDEKLNKWKNEKVNLALTGCSCTGKSTFVNRIRNLKPGDADYAKTGFGNTTLQPTLYMHPRNDQIAFYDLPGYETLQFRRKDYISAMKISDYDFFFIFLNHIRSEEELWMVGELRKMGKPFALVRSKIDRDIDYAIYDGKDPKTIIPKMKEQIEIFLNSNPELKSTKGIFLISSRNPDLGDWSELMVFLEESIDGFKSEALLCSLQCITKKMLEMKYKMLKKRIFLVTALATSVAAIPVPFLDVAITIPILVHEVRHYMRVFGIEPERVNTLENFDHSVLKSKYLVMPNLNMVGLIVSKIKVLLTLVLANSAIDVIAPLIGSVISSFNVASATYKFLDDTLQDTKDDAMLIYEHTMNTNADRRM